jgi:hypothetical protein
MYNHWTPVMACDGAEEIGYHSGPVLQAARRPFWEHLFEDNLAQTLWETRAERRERWNCQRSLFFAALSGSEAPQRGWRSVKH